MMICGYDSGGPLISKNSSRKKDHLNIFQVRGRFLSRAFAYFPMWQRHSLRLEIPKSVATIDAGHSGKCHYRLAIFNAN
jgi:hypothetical protein